MKASGYLKMFGTKGGAMDWARCKNRACKLAGNARDIYVVTAGPDGDWAVMDLAGAIEHGQPYKWEI